MEIIIEFFEYVYENKSYLTELTIDYILLVVYAMAGALIIGIPLGFISAKYKKAAPIILGIANFLQVTPSLATLAIMMLILGLGFESAAISLLVYSLLPIIRNTYVGLNEVDKNLLDTGKGIGMTPFQVLTKIQFPLSIPVLMAGVRVAAVVAIGVASIAPFIGGGGLGNEILDGIQQYQPVKIYAGAIPAALLAILADLILGLVEKQSKSKIS